MKIVKTAAGMLLLIFLCVSVLSSCTMFDFSVESLLHPPKLTGENALIQRAFEDSVGTDVLLVSPLTGEYRSAFVQYDIDQNGSEETLVFYAKTASPNEAHMHILKYDGENWFSAGDVAGNGSEVYSIGFFNFDNDPSMEIAVSWAVSDSKRIKTLALYQFNESEASFALSPLSVLQIYDYMVSDFDFDGRQELMYLMDNSSDQDNPFIANVIKMLPSEGTFGYVCELKLSPSINWPAKVSFDIADGTYRLYIDCANNDGTYMTEVLYFDCESSVLSRITDEDGISLSSQTYRHAEVYCEDVNNDHVIEVPMEKYYEGALIRSLESGAESEMQIIAYAKINGNRIDETSYHYFYAPGGLFRYRVDAFLSQYRAEYMIENAELIFYTSDDSNAKVFTVKYTEFANQKKDIFVEIAEPAVTQMKEQYLKSLAEIL